MMNTTAVAVADAYWAAFFGMPREDLFSARWRIVDHAEELHDYRGVYGLFRRGAAVISVPPDRRDKLRSLLETRLPAITPDEMKEALAEVTSRVIGPAWIGYAPANVGMVATPSDHCGCRALSEADREALDALRAACDPTEWEHGGSELSQPCSGVFVDGRLVALAGYEVWGGTIAHISVVTHPGHRGFGHGRSVVDHLASRAAAAGLLPQYRTLLANGPSMKVAANLGFEEYAVSLAMRL